MVSSSCMGERFKSEPGVDMELLSEEDICCLLGEHGRELGCFDDFHHLSPGHGPFSGWDAGWIFDKNISFGQCVWFLL